MTRRVKLGKPYPLGSTWLGDGVNFAIYSEHAEKVELCLFDSPTAIVESERIPLTEVTAHIWHAYVCNIGLGQTYAYRIYGPYDPEKGLRFNHNKLLVDPYAKAITGTVDNSAPIFGYNIGHPNEDLSFNTENDVGYIPRCVVVDASFPWENDQLPRIPWSETVIYELHVKGFTIKNPDVPRQQRGTYIGLASPAVIEYLLKLGVTTVELMPVHTFITDKYLADKGLTNYWGYNTLNYFSPSGLYSSSGDTGQQVTEFKSMVKMLHRAGLEVILDVVYNHTAEGNQLGPTLSFRGIDNPTYYSLYSENKRYYMDYSGTGNSLNVNHPQVLKMVMDSLRYWVTEMHVDGFRFDLASALAREADHVDKLSAFFDIIHQDPVISQVKLIAEPWDIGEGGYQVGNFPILWTEWNGKYRDTIRRFWRGDAGQMAELGYRLTGSSDLYEWDGRSPYASINFIVCHDGFTLEDLVSYNDKHNDVNGEENQDGSDENLSWNCGREGPAEVTAIIALREQQKRNFLATLMLSQGVPMLCAGDEVCRTQRGNNNAYCQDNDISWLDWQMDDRKTDLLEFTRKLISLRKSHAIFHRRKFFQGRPIHGSDIKDVIWLRPDGEEMTDSDWESEWIRCIGTRIDGKASHEINEDGSTLVDDDFFLILNSYHKTVKFRLPAFVPGAAWEIVIDTNIRAKTAKPATIKGGDPIIVPDRSLILLSRLNGKEQSDDQL
ncbi:MAG: glycogen debranching protein GlgX [Dehalococcoidia bacterium]|nr:glycogen debranching protein GlgX [Dehalococcoidia bacterium]